MKKIRRFGIYDEKTGKINNNFKAIYAYEYDSGASNLVLEEGNALSLKFWPIDKILNTQENEKKKFVPAFFTDDYFEIFNMIKNIAKEETPQYIDNLGVYISRPKKHSSSLAILLPGYLDSQNYNHIISLRKILSQNGFIAISLDATGIWYSNHNDINNYSVSRYITDVEKIITYFKSLQKVECIILIGHSGGGQVAILTAARNHNISSVVAIMPPQGSGKKDKWVPGKPRESSRDLPFDSSKKIKFLVPYSFFEDAKQYNLLNIIDKIKIPVLFIGGETDTVIPIEKIKEIYDKANEPKSFIIMKKIGHDYRFNKDKTDKVNNIIINFLTKHKLIK